MAISGFSVTTFKSHSVKTPRELLEELLPQPCRDDVLGLIDNLGSSTSRAASSVMAMRCEMCPPTSPPTQEYATVGNKVLCLTHAGWT